MDGAMVLAGVVEAGLHIVEEILSSDDEGRAADASHGGKKCPEHAAVKDGQNAKADGSENEEDSETHHDGRKKKSSKGIGKAIKKMFKTIVSTDLNSNAPPNTLALGTDAPTCQEGTKRSSVCEAQSRQLEQGSASAEEKDDTKQGEACHHGKVGEIVSFFASTVYEGVHAVTESQKDALYFQERALKAEAENVQLQRKILKLENEVANLKASR